MMDEAPPPVRPLWVNALLLSLAGLIFVTMLGLGIWQVQRLSWKLDLIEAVEARAFNPATAPPSGTVTPREHAYLRVTLTGTFDYQEARRVKAVTELGPGHWVLVPLKAPDRFYWINRGFVPTGLPDRLIQLPKGPQQVEGLLRITEPNGTLLEQNDPVEERWVSRDVSALSAAAGLTATAPFFVDADHVGAPDAWPRGGLTKVIFRNSHLTYAITWFAMAALFLAGMIYVLQDVLRARRSGPESAPNVVPLRKPTR